MDTKVKNQFTIVIVVNAILLIGLVVLFFLFFNQGEKDSVQQDKTMYNQIKQVPSSGSNSIAFVNSDVLLKKYSLVQDLTDELDKERKKKDADFKSKQKAYESDASYFQEQVQNQTISEQSAQQIYEQLMMKQQELYSLQDQYSAELAQKEYETNIVIVDSVRNYLHRVNGQYNFDYILSYNEAGNILLAKDTFDITEVVLQGLNEEYQKAQSPEK
ncbi:MAG: OmpH family outer membrane protein [Bacteroidales bacterium]|nr:OmpH family outer membrane protein [Bacteroidales bacterium]